MLEFTAPREDQGRSMEVGSGTVKDELEPTSASWSRQDDLSCLLQPVCVAFDLRLL